MTNPYLITGPALISFSGGRTSGYMVHEIVRAHGGTLPDDVHVLFANTGKEREETLRYVHECGSRWNLRIVWLEWRDTDEQFEVVGLNSASRRGEPFKALIEKKKALPNGTARWCTSFLKIVPMHGYMKSLGYEQGTYREAVGLRHDEGLRLLTMYANNERDNRQCVAPLSKSKIVKADVMAFWKGQPFDLALRSWEGNCDFCFNKGRAIRERIARDNPDVPLWWIGEESAIGKTFAMRESVSEIVEYVQRTPMLIPDDPTEEHDVECGLHCEVAA
ncbi:MAG: 3'-phosphoadenosine 5'-phosphosulfate sulfotransferase [Mesorhizobium sp.]|uniref:phosphoadenosine phosphosulfate reductase domain-containing protein n=1 Tax=unclassified Mesorhizobium TaxID=325217 RepID=UPI000FCBDE3F|nr:MULTISPECIES: phosphoadenosine phosphosulfate reductase family protein [unclassified Mesorhizobium]RUV66220.1 3'-phosphoadenosine 5'-phosphosulfate sulfotransferase [Mesorhizobium sp. M5C.F.Cr.IN.023.01.1.1]RWI51065.1 MAG: 3'-phosphoadenosine 5'-phosphosulfate sulfotransferase [Mesorhizobium sp.]RWI62053.1 MAG: 3'-phosphoadenosine 5'-phosphosulfate sulfotransferase [Mesorhizobium sp.]RWJ13903.1 MAG: 3'-phosphoadenosine 5'-phosphosulfate sulfotransferase [Mesorhizobium sp.]RWJ16871.1 MAG: 3'